MRKTISLLLALFLILSLLIVTVSAAETVNQVAVISGGTTTEFADYKAGFKAAKAGDTIKLLTDITLYGSESLTIPKGADLTVDGNGKPSTPRTTAFTARPPRQTPEPN